MAERSNRRAVTRLLAFDSTFDGKLRRRCGYRRAGGGVYNSSTTDAVINNSLFTEAPPPRSAARTRHRTSSCGTPHSSGTSRIRTSTGLWARRRRRLRNCIAWDNGPNPIPASGNVATHSIVEGGFAGVGNLSADSSDEPLFVNRAGGDFRLVAGSPRIDAADSTAWPGALSTDFNGEPRVVNTGGSATGVPVFGYYIDMGAFEFQPGPPAQPASAIPTAMGSSTSRT